MPEDRQPARAHACLSCGGRFTNASPPPNTCHGGGSCPFDEPDMWESYEPDPVADWGPFAPDVVAAGGDRS